MPVPNRLNVALVLLDVVAAICLLWLGAWLESTPFGETHFDNPTGGNTNAITLW